MQGVLGASADGTHLYFAANGRFGAGEATLGDCDGSVAKPSGSCNAYLWHDGAIDFVARLKAGGSFPGALNWTGTPRELFSTAGLTPKTAFVSHDGRILLFRSQEKLTAYDNEGIPELYRYSAANQKTVCVSCPPSGDGVVGGSLLGSILYPGPISPPLRSVAMVESRNLSADGNRVFFETTEALVPEDTNGQQNCVSSSCLDTYEWEAPGSGSCEANGSGYSPLNDGCVYLISTGTSEFPSFFADASANGNDVLFFTRQQLVGQDQDELQDVYDARVGGGLAAQNQVAAAPCASAEDCRDPVQVVPSELDPGTSGFLGPGDPRPRRKKKRAHGKHRARNHVKAQVKGKRTS